MLIEVIVVVASCIWVSGSLVSVARSFHEGTKPPIAMERASPPVMKSYKTQTKADPIIKLVDELLQRDGWTQDGKYLYHAQADIRLLRMYNRDDPQCRVFVKNNEQYENAGLTQKEEIQVGKLVNAYTKKQAEQRKLALAKVVSDRIVKQMFLDQPGLVIRGPARTATVGSPAVGALTYDPNSNGLSIESMSRNTREVMSHGW